MWQCGIRSAGFVDAVLWGGDVVGWVRWRDCDRFGVEAEGLMSKLVSPVRPDVI